MKAMISFTVGADHCMGTDHCKGAEAYLCFLLTCFMAQVAVINLSNCQKSLKTFITRSEYNKSDNVLQSFENLNIWKSKLHTSRY